MFLVTIQGAEVACNVVRKGPTAISRLRDAVSTKLIYGRFTVSLSGIFNLLQQYAGAGASSATANTERDFEKVSQNTDSSQLAQGLTHAFRSDQTPPFAEKWIEEIAESASKRSLKRSA